MAAIRRGRTESGLIVALLNATGLGLGYAYLRAWRWFCSAPPVTGVLAVAANAWDAAERPWTWIAVFGVWLSVTVAHGWVLGTRSRGPERGTTVERIGSTDSMVVYTVTDDRPGRRSPVLSIRGVLPFLAAAAALALVVTGYVHHRATAEQVYQQGYAAHQEGDCEKALADYRRLDSAYQLSFSPVLSASEDDAPGCEILVSAAAERADGSYRAAINLHEDYLDRYGGEAPWDGAEAALAGLRMDYGSALAATAAEQGLPDGAGFTRRALVEFQDVVDLHPESPEAEAVPAAIEDMYAHGTSAVEAEEFCLAVTQLDFFAEMSGELTATLTETARAALPEALHGCALEHGDADEFTEAVDQLERLGEEFGDHPLAEEVDSLVAEMEGRAEDQRAEEEERGIREEIDRLSDGRTNELPPPTASGSAPVGTVTVQIDNSSGRGLEVLYTGPETGRVSIDAAGSCGASSTTLSLTPGTYQMIVRVTGGGIRPYVGSWNLSSGTAYSECYYITTGW